METSEQGRVKSDEPAASDPRKGLTDFPFGPGASRFWVYFMTLTLPTLALILILFYCISLSGWGWDWVKAFTPSIMVAWASLGAGAFLGFLFAIPRAQPASSTLAGNAEGAKGKLLVNTNLEQVSDWLTKIIVGVTLIEIGTILPALGRLVGLIASIYGDGAPGAEVMAAAILLLFSVLGFFDGYIGTRSLLTVIFETVRTN